MSLSNRPDYKLIQGGNKLGKKLENCSFGLVSAYGDAVVEVDTELESRIPIFNPEYDATGQIITSELMGYTEEDEEIWTTANF